MQQNNYIEKLPLMNEQINIGSNQKCVVYGIQSVPASYFVQKQSNLPQNQKQRISFQKNPKKNKYFDDQAMIGFRVQKNSYQTIQYQLAKRIANELDLDICLMRDKQISEVQVEKSDTSTPLSPQSNQQQGQQRPIISLTRYKEYIYRQYFTKQLKTKSRRTYIQHQLKKESLIDQSQIFRYKGGEKNRIKTLRIGDDVHIHDLNNKKNQINKWLEQGQRTIKIISNNTSSKSQKALHKFCSMFNKQVQVIYQKIQQNPRQKPIQRLYAILQFEQEIEVDIDFVNRRWRRREAEIKFNQLTKKTINNPFQFNLTNEDPSFQRGYLKAFQQSGIPYPEQYSYLNQFQRKFQKQGMMSLVREVVQQHKNIQNPYDEPELTQQQAERRDKQFRRIMEARTVEDILGQMEQLKSRSYEMQHYESQKYKQLEKQLKTLLQDGSEIKKQKSKSKKR